MTGLPIVPKWRPLLEQCVENAIGHAWRRATKYDDRFPDLTDGQLDDLQSRAIEAFWSEVEDAFDYLDTGSDA